MGHRGCRQWGHLRRGPGRVQRKGSDRPDRSRGHGPHDLPGRDVVRADRDRVPADCDAANVRACVERVLAKSLRHDGNGHTARRDPVHHRWQRAVGDQRNGVSGSDHNQLDRDVEGPCDQSRNGLEPGLRCVLYPRRPRTSSRRRTGIPNRPGPRDRERFGNAPGPLLCSRRPARVAGASTIRIAIPVSRRGASVVTVMVPLRRSRAAWTPARRSLPADRLRSRGPGWHRPGQLRSRSHCSSSADESGGIVTRTRQGGPSLDRQLDQRDELRDRARRDQRGSAMPFATVAGGRHRRSPCRWAARILA